MKQYELINERSIHLLDDPHGLSFAVCSGPDINLAYDEMIAEIKAGTAVLLPIPPEIVHWKDKRQARIADGGYGSILEQLEMIGEGGASTIASYQTHIAAVKARFPKA